jgi:hypothetical protein
MKKFKMLSIFPGWDAMSEKPSHATVPLRLTIEAKHGASFTLRIKDCHLLTLYKKWQLISLPSRRSDNETFCLFGRKTKAVLSYTNEMQHSVWLSMREIVLILSYGGRAVIF